MCSMINHPSESLIGRRRCSQLVATGNRIDRSRALHSSFILCLLEFSLPLLAAENVSVSLVYPRISFKTDNTTYLVLFTSYHGIEHLVSCLFFFVDLFTQAKHEMFPSLSNYTFNAGYIRVHHNAVYVMCTHMCPIRSSICQSGYGFSGFFDQCQLLKK